MTATDGVQMHKLIFYSQFLVYEKGKPRSNTRAEQDWLYLLVRTYSYLQYTLTSNKSPYVRSVKELMFNQIPTSDPVVGFEHTRGSSHHWSGRIVMFV